ncbi:MAG: hypothetical protein IJU60_01880 [Acholeplasmatales bacterium]|nr:hypothetical protein [Acholeplasmatales bacterium]
MNSNVFDELVIVKRSGQRVSFNKAKIAIAIKKAFDSTYDNYDINSINKIYSDVLNFIEENYKDRKTINVEDIQDIIENTLNASSYKEAYEAFKEYRIKRAQSRDLFTTKQQHKFLKAMEFLASKGVESFQSILTFESSISTEYARAYLLDNKYTRSHDEGIIFIHNLGYYSFKISKGSVLDLSKIEINDNYIFYLISFLRNIKKEQYGEHVLASLDKVFNPYYIYLYKNYLTDYLTKYLELEGLLPYINITALKDEISMIDDIDSGVKSLEKYFKSKATLDLFTKCVSDSLSATNSKVYSDLKNLLLSIDDESFPRNEGYTVSFGSSKGNIGNVINKMIVDIFKTTDFKFIHFNYKIEDNKSVDELLELVETKKDFNVINLKSSANVTTASDIEYFFLGEKILDNINEEKKLSLGRIMLANTSINLARIAMQSKDNETFYASLNSCLELCKNELLVAFENMCNYYKENYNYLFNDKVILDSEKLEAGQKVRKILRGGVLYINLVGLAEAARTFFKNKKGDVLKLLEYLNDYASKISNEERLNFSISGINYADASAHFINIDKTILAEQVDSNKSTYDEAYKAFDNVSDIASYEKLTNGGHRYVIEVGGKTSTKKIKDMLNDAITNDVAFLSIRCGD